MLIAYLPCTIYYNSLDFTKFPLTKVSNLIYVIFKNMQNGVLEYKVKMEKC